MLLPNKNAIVYGAGRRVTCGTTAALNYKEPSIAFAQHSPAIAQGPGGPGVHVPAPRAPRPADA